LTIKSAVPTEETKSPPPRPISPTGKPSEKHLRKLLKISPATFKGDTDTLKQERITVKHWLKHRVGSDEYRDLLK
jgi:hypothetical protein